MYKTGFKKKKKKKKNIKWLHSLSGVIQVSGSQRSQIDSQEVIYAHAPTSDGVCAPAFILAATAMSLLHKRVLITSFQVHLGSQDSRDQSEFETWIKPDPNRMW